MRTVIVLAAVFAISGCSHSGAVRKPEPGSVAAWWQHLRELNRPDPDRTQFAQQLSKLTPRQRQKIGFP
ncbi:MAG: hypothetical protein NVSMB9_34180 [Isosphaeraceae bacterium]